MKAIFKRELKAYFSTPIGYLVLAAYYFFLGLFFTITYSAGSPDVSIIITAMATVAIFTVPIITMRLISEDRRQKVDQALLTAPVKLSGIVLGKFFAAMALFAIGFAPAVVFELIVISHVTVNVLSFLYALLGVLLLGGALISIGIFISSLTESPTVSAILGIMVNFVIMYMSSIAQMITVPSATETVFQKVWASIVKGFVTVLEKSAFISVFENFGESVFSFADVIYFLSIIGVFIFLTVRSLEKRRWS